MSRNAVTAAALLAQLSFCIGAGAQTAGHHQGHQGHHHDRGATVGSPHPAPSIVITEVKRDSVSGYNIRIETTRFTFRAEKEGHAHAASEGHVRLYINDKKITRLYCDGWHHIPAAWLRPGENTVMLSLSANTHAEYAHHGQPLRASVRLHYR